MAIEINPKAVEKVKEIDLEEVTTLKDTDFIRVVTDKGESVKISLANLKALLK